MQTTAQTPLKSLESLSPKATLENLQVAIKSTQENIKHLESRLKTLEDSGDFATIHSENLFSLITTEKTSLGYYEKQLPGIQAKLQEYEKLQARDKALQDLEAVKPVLSELIAEYNDARKQLLSAQKRISSLDRQLAKQIGLANGGNGGSLFPFYNEFLEPNQLPLITLTQLNNAPGIVFKFQN